jgi:GNAT superfamily N-acetyltransferase
MRIIEPFTAEFYRATHRRTHWALEFLAVHPVYQGEGRGRELVQVGMSTIAGRCGAAKERDDNDRLPVSVIAAEGKEGFYQKCGFNELVGWVSESEPDGQENPLKAHGIGGCAVLWTR